MTEKKENTTKRETKIRDLDCNITTEELEDYSQLMTGAMLEINAEQEALKDHSKIVKGRIAKHKAEVTRLLKIVNTRIESRKVDCEAVFDYEANNVTVRRLDTDEVIEDRPLAELEKQIEMDFESGDEGEEVDLDKVEIQEDTETRENDCPECSGDGTQIDGFTPCENCKGQGVIEDETQKSEEVKND